MFPHFPNTYEGYSGIVYEIYAILIFFNGMSLSMVAVKIVGV